ncbi:MAG: hypothetical protein ACKV19_28495 [Verrucomicrobiales bacterium]
MRDLPGGLGRGARTVALLALAGMVCGDATAVEPASEQPAPRIGVKAGPEETLSSSGQFLAHGGGKEERARVVTAVEDIRDAVSRLLDRQARTGESAPSVLHSELERPSLLLIHVWLKNDAQASVQPRLYRVAGVPEPVMGVVLARASLASGDDFRREVIRLLLVERMLSGQPQAGGMGGGEVLPAWLEVGVVEALDYLRLGRPSDGFGALFSKGRILEIEQILTEKPSRLEAGARQVYAASACCLILTLLEQPQGPERFRSFLQAIPGRKGSWSDLLVRQFPGLALSRHSLEKWWTLQAAALATPDLLEPMTADETDRWLEKALVVRYRSDEGGTRPSASVLGWLKGRLPGRAPAARPAESAASSEETELTLADLDRIAKLPKRADVIRGNQGALSGLLLRACPLYRPIIVEYQDVLGKLSLGKTADLAARCEQLASRRRALLATAEATSDYLNWYEATQRSQLSGSFASYFRRLEVPAAPPAAAKGMDDPIARSLEALEVEFEGK